MMFSVKIWCKTGFPSPDAYVYTRVRVRKIRMARKIYATFYLKYILNPFSVDLVQGGFRKPRRVCLYASLGEQNSYGAQDLRRNFWLYISMPFSVDLVQGGFCEPRRVLRYASSGEQKPHCAQDLRCILFEVYIKPV